jgi:hypothetical protein
MNSSMRAVSHQRGVSPCDLIRRKYGNIKTNVYISTGVNPQIRGMTHWKNIRKYTIPRVLRLSIATDNICGLAALPIQKLVKSVRATRSPMIWVTTDVARLFLFISLLFEVGRLWWLVLPIKLSFALDLFLFLNLWDWKFLFYTTLALDPPSLPRARVSFALAFSSTLRNPMRYVMENYCLLCFREVAKYLHEGGSLAIMPPATNLSGNTQVKCSSSLANDCISWA